MWTLQNMITMVRNQTQESSTRRYSDAMIASLINDGVDFIGSLCATYANQLLRVKGTTNTVASRNEYPIPFLAKEVETVEILDSDSEYKPMRPVSDLEAWRYEDEDFDRDTTLHYVVRGRSIHILEGTTSGADSVSTITNGLRVQMIKRPAHLHYATAGGGGTNYITFPSSGHTGEFLNLDDLYVGEWVYIVSGTGSGQLRQIITYDTSARKATVDSDWDTDPDGTSVYSLISMLPLELHPLFIQYAEGQINRDRSGIDVTAKFLSMIGGIGPQGPEPVQVKPWGL